ncbi:MAG TPA: methyltransferase domain-containing protein [Bacillota bacterium]|nr:methyltransferase domain-containing protein [Bacillota bacterium]
MTAHAVYKYPRYYDIAFGWEPGPETDFLQAVFRRAAPGEVRSVLDVACGSGRFAFEFARRGLSVAGLDISPEMLDYLGKKAALAGLPVEVFVRDMRDFQLPRRGFDAAICMTDSFGYLLDIAAITGHLHSVARHLGSRGIYVVDFGTVVDPGQPFGPPERWEMTRDEVRVNFTGNQWEDYDPVRQTVTEVLRMDVLDQGQAQVIEQRAVKRVIYPQEFLALVGVSGVFELAEWFQGFDLERPFAMPPYHRRIIAVLRKIGEPPPPPARPRPDAADEPARSSRGARRPRRRSPSPARPTPPRPPEQEEPAPSDAGGRSPRRRSRAKPQTASPPKSQTQARPEAAVSPPESKREVEREREDHPPSGRRKPRAAAAPPSVRLPAGRADDEPIVEYWARGKEDKWQPPRAPRPAVDEPPAAGDQPPAPTTKTRRPRRRRKKTDGGTPPEESAGGQGG